MAVFYDLTTRCPWSPSYTTSVDSSLPERLRQLSQSDPVLRSTELDSTRLEPLLASMNSAMESLREITRGVFPAQLARSGLPTALGSLLARPGRTGPQRLTIEDSAAGRRFDPRVEAAAYFCVAEATRAFEHPVAVVLSVRGDQLSLSVSGTDRGGLSLSHMRDRMEATGGSVSTTFRDGQTFVEVRASSGALVHADAALHASTSRSGLNADLVT